MQIHKAEFVKSVVQGGTLPEEGLPEVVFIGRSNVGKSTLINLLLNRKDLARTSGKPGKTQEFNYYRINDAFFLVDVPGYGYAKTSKKKRAEWRELIDTYLMERERLRAVFHLIDSRHPPTDLDHEMLELMMGQWAPYVVVLTKADKLSGNERPKSVKRMTEELGKYGLQAPIILTSSKTKRGRKELLSWLESFVA